MRSWIQCFLQQQHQKPKQTEPMKSTIKAKTIAPKQKASISSKGGRIKATKPAKPAALDKTITIARVNATAAVNNGQVAATTSRTPICKRRLKSAAGGTEWCGGRKVRHLQINHGGCSLICSNGPRYAAEF